MSDSQEQNRIDDLLDRIRLSAERLADDVTLSTLDNWFVVTVGRGAFPRAVNRIAATAP